MTSQGDIAAIQACISNRLPSVSTGDRRIAGVIGEASSQYSKSPALWNAAFHLLGINAVYLPFDLEPRRLKDFVSAMRDCAGLLGVNVTLPHKLEIMEYVDIIDAGAARVRAVNTVVRAENGKLIGYNTDGEGFIESILKPQPGQRDSFLESLADMNVLLLGAGGSAHAVALQVAEQLNRGQLLICNRTLEHAQGLAAEIGKVGLRASVVLEAQLPERACTVGLIVNSTTKGQGGLRRPEPGTVTTMEPYSALAPAHPVAVPEFEYGKPDSQEKTAQAFQSDVQKNNEASMKLAASVPKSVRFYDLIYSPEETVFLRHGRLTGHPTMNGKAMLINQAVIGFCKRICHAELQARGLHEPEVYQRVLAAMYGAW